MRAASTFAGDTSPDAARVQREIVARMTPDERLRMAFEASEFVRALALEGIAMRHPEYTPEQRKSALFTLLYGEELFRSAYPGVEPARP